MESLQNLCLSCMTKNFVSLPKVHWNLLSSVDKTKLLHRMINHDLLNTNLSTLCYYLLTPALKYLDIYGSSQIDDDFVMKLAQVGAQFESIRLIRCIRLSDKGLAELLLNQYELQHLEFRWLTIDGYCLTKLL